MNNLAHKIQLKPTKEQEEFFNKACGVSRFTYNWGLEKCHKIRKETGKNPSLTVLKKEFNAIKKEQFPWIYESPKDANQQPFSDLQKAWQRFWAELKKGKTPVWNKKDKKHLESKGIKHSQMAFAPKFKSVKDKQSFYLSNDKFGIIENKVRIPLLGLVVMTEEVRFKGNIVSGVVSKQGTRWFLSINVDVPEEQYYQDRKSEGIIGIDLGIKDAAILSNGERFEAPKPLAKYQKRLKLRQRKASRKREAQKKEGREYVSNRQRRQYATIAKTHARVGNIRKDFQHKLSTKIVSENQAVVLEDLNVSGMLKNRNLAKAVSDIGMFEIRRQVEYKADRYKTKVVIADRWYPSSKTCSECGYILEELKLSTRSWSCPECNQTHDRDINAANNLRNLVKEIYPEATGKLTPCQI